MLDAIPEHTMHTILKAIVLLTAWMGFAIEQVGGEVEQVVNEAFELSFSLGVLVLLVIYFIYENRTKDSKRDEIQLSMVNLLEKNITAINDFSQSNRDVVSALERLQEANITAIKNMTKELDKIEDRLNG